MKKLLCITLSILLVVSMFGISAFAKTDYTINSPYADVVWEGENAWGAYKGNLHSHSYVSDADEDYSTMIKEYYNQGFDFLAVTDHGVTGKAWNEKPTQLPLYLYQYIIGNNTTYLTDEEFEAITTGTYPVDGTARGKGMTCVIGGNELNALTMTKSHVNGIFLPEHYGDNYLGYENDYEGAVKLVDDAGGDALSFINHPGDWLHSNRDRGVCSDSENIKYFADIILKYDSCLGMEVFNEKNSVTPYDRVLWDGLLTECLPYGKTVIAFSNTDAHNVNDIDSSYMIYMMEDNTVENIRNTMINGAFFSITRKLPADEILGPTQEIDARNDFSKPIPEFTEVSVDGHTVTVKAKNCYNIQWVADGKVIASKDVEQSGDITEYTIDLDALETVENPEDLLYIRCQLLGEGGCNLTQALTIDNGTQPKTYEPDTSTQAKAETAWYRFTSLRIFVLFQVLFDKIISKLS